MPTIIVRADDSGGDPGTVTLRERTVPCDLHNEHYVTRLIERVAWALHDAEGLELRTNVEPASPAAVPSRVDGARRRRRHAPDAQPTGAI